MQQERSWILRKNVSWITQVEEHWKISSQIISWLQRIQIETIMIETIQQYCLVFPEQGTDMQAHGRSQFRESKFTRRQSLMIFYWITTGPWRTLGRRHACQTVCRLWVALFPIKGSGDSSFRPFSAQKKIETAVLNSVRRKCWNGFWSVHTE